jgi:hypothetical protein
MLPITSPASSFLALPAELRKSIYDVADKQTLGRLAQTSKQVNNEINPVVEKLGQEKRSPWDTLCKREFPNFGVPTAQKLQPKPEVPPQTAGQLKPMRQPQSAQSLYQGARLQYRNRVRDRLGFVISVANDRDYLTDAEGRKTWRSLNAAVRHPKG